MRIYLLGTAAGGGVPQWNCNCVVCREAREVGGRVRVRTQSSVAVSADGQRWFLLNASPDIRAQIERFAPLRSSAEKSRGSAIEGVLLTDGELDSTLGLFLLREGEKLRVHATAEVQRSMTEGLALEKVLASFSGIEWLRPGSERRSLFLRNGSESGLSYEVVALPGKPPRFMNGHEATGRWAAACRITDTRTGGRLVFAPGVARLDDALLGFLRECEVLLFDGTFWSENEMRERRVGTLSASDMGHLPIGGPTGSLAVLSGLKVNHRIYTHINNTNPVLIEGSPECTAVTAAGWTVGQDGVEIEI